MDKSEFPANSRLNREPAKEEQPEKKVESVVSGPVKRRKKPLGRKFLDTFIAGESESVGRHILMEIIIPSVKDIIADTVTQAIERTLFGESRSTPRRPGFRPGGSTAGHTSYNRYSGGNNARPTPRLTRPAHDFDEIVLATRGEADEVIDRMFDLIARYEQVTVGDLYDLLGVTSKFTDQKWGWRDIRGIGVTRINHGYLLDLPKPIELD